MPNDLRSQARQVRVGSNYEKKKRKLQAKAGVDLNAVRGKLTVIAMLRIADHGER